LGGSGVATRDAPGGRQGLQLRARPSFSRHLLILDGPSFSCLLVLLLARSLFVLVLLEAASAFAWRSCFFAPRRGFASTTSRGLDSYPVRDLPHVPQLRRAHGPVDEDLAERAALRQRGEVLAKTSCSGWRYSGLTLLAQHGLICLTRVSSYQGPSCFATSLATSEDTCIRQVALGKRLPVEYQS